MSIPIQAVEDLRYGNLLVIDWQTGKVSNYDSSKCEENFTRQPIGMAARNIKAGQTMYYSAVKNTKDIIVSESDMIWEKRKIDNEGD